MDFLLMQELTHRRHFMNMEFIALDEIMRRARMHRIKRPYEGCSVLYMDYWYL